MNAMGAASQQFAATTAGWITGILLPIMAAALTTWWFMGRPERQRSKDLGERRLRSIEDAVLRLTTIVEQHMGKHSD